MRPWCACFARRLDRLLACILRIRRWPGRAKPGASAAERGLRCSLLAHAHRPRTDSYPRQAQAGGPRSARTRSALRLAPAREPGWVPSVSMRVGPTRIRHMALLAAVSVLVAAAARGQATSQPTSAPADAESYERTLREERARHADQVRKLTEEQDRLRAALESVKARVNEAEARRASLRKLVDEARAAAAAFADRMEAARAAANAMHETLARALQRVSEAGRTRAAPDVEIARVDVPLARRIRLLLQFLDRESQAARTVTTVPRERQGVLGHEVRLGALATFFVPTAEGPTVLEPSGREVPGPTGDALREVVRQVSKRGGRGSIVNIPWWGGP